VTSPDRLRIVDESAWVGDRRMPEGARVISHDEELEHPEDGRRFESRTRLFALPFENGWTMKVEWGRDFARVDPENPFVEAAEAARVTISDRQAYEVMWDEVGRPVAKSLDRPGVRPDVPAREILELIDEVATWPTDYLPIVGRV